MNSTIISNSPKLSYEQVVAVTQNPIFIGVLIVIWFIIGILLYLVIAGSVRARLHDGTKLKRSMLSSPNAWLIPLIIWILQAGLILLLIVFPIWARSFK